MYFERIPNFFEAESIPTGETTELEGETAQKAWNNSEEALKNRQELFNTLAQPQSEELGHFIKNLDLKNTIAAKFPPINALALATKVELLNYRSSVNILRERVATDMQNDPIQSAYKGILDRTLTEIEKALNRM
jgi:hypothetical protein